MIFRSPSPAFLLCFYSFILLCYSADAQINFTGSGQVSSGSSITGTLTDAESDTVGYAVSTTGPLFFGWNGDESSESGGVKENFGAGQGPFDWVFTMLFDDPVASLTLGQVSNRTIGANNGGALSVTSDATNATVVAGTQGLGSDGLSNLNGVSIAGGDVNANLAMTFNDEADWSISLSDVQSVTVRYTATASAPANVGNEWFTFTDVDVLVVPEPSTSSVVAGIVTYVCMRRRRAHR